MKVKFSNKDIKFLRKWYPTHGVWFCVKKLGFTYRRTLGKAVKLGIKRQRLSKAGHKICGRCKKELSLKNFGIQKGRHYGKSHCKDCENKRARHYYKNNSEKVCKRTRRYQKDNREKYNENRRNRIKNDPSFKFCANTRRRISLSLQKQKANKSARTIKLLGCNFKNHEKHRESKFKNGMTWENYGTIWEMDHIIPCDLFDLTKASHQKKCFHYTNTQPLWATTAIAIDNKDFNTIGNREKGNKIIYQNLENHSIKILKYLSKYNPEKFS